MGILMKVFLKKDSGLKPVQMIKDFSPQRSYIIKIMFYVIRFFYLGELKNIINLV